MAGYGDEIRRLREKRGWKQADLAAAAGVDKQTVNRAETGRNVSVFKLTLISAAFGVDVSVLFCPDYAGDEDWLRLRRLNDAQRAVVRRLMRQHLGEK